MFFLISFCYLILMSKPEDVYAQSSQSRCFKNYQWIILYQKDSIVVNIARQLYNMLVLTIYWTWGSTSCSSHIVFILMQNIFISSNTWAFYIVLTFTFWATASIVFKVSLRRIIWEISVRHFSFLLENFFMAAWFEPWISPTK